MSKYLDEATKILVEYAEGFHAYAKSGGKLTSEAKRLGDNAVEKVIRLLDEHKQMLDALEYIARWLNETGLDEEVHPSVVLKIEAALEAARGTGDSA